MANLDLIGQVPIEIDGTIVLTAANLSVREATPTTVKKGALGPIGVAQGIPDVTASFRLAAPKTGLELNLELLRAKPGGFTLGFQAGLNRYLIIGCKVSERGLEVDQGAGNVEVPVTLTGTEMIRRA